MRSGASRPGSAPDIIAWASNIPTGIKLLLTLSAALLPLAVIGFYASLKSIQLDDAAVGARLRVAATESARKLAIELGGDLAALRAVADALETEPDDGAACARAHGIFSTQEVGGVRFAIIDRTGQVICGVEGLPTIKHTADAQERPPPALAGINHAQFWSNGLLVTSTPANGGFSTRLHFPAAFIAGITLASDYEVPFGERLVIANDSLALVTLMNDGKLARRERARVALRIDGLQYEMSIQRTPISSPVLVAMLLPFLMWVAAVSIAWLVVDRLLIKPLRALRANVAAYSPGELVDPAVISTLPAQEIRELGDSFHLMSRTVAEHQADLADGLVRQTKLTREVHHRVKNNLQVIASLINFHARGARGEEATAAYATIQRRVDALAVVHRHHFADLEDSRGLSLRSVIGELAAGIRANAAASGTPAAITLDVEPLMASQDIAMPVAFLLTELLEMALAIDPGSVVDIALVLPAGTDEGTHNPRARLSITACSLRESTRLVDLMATRYGRVIDGLAKQLRAPLRHDRAAGLISIDVPVTGRD